MGVPQSGRYTSGWPEVRVKQNQFATNKQPFQALKPQTDDCFLTKRTSYQVTIFYSASKMEGGPFPSIYPPLET